MFGWLHLLRRSYTLLHFAGASSLARWTSGRAWRAARGRGDWTLHRIFFRIQLEHPILSTCIKGNIVNWILHAKFNPEVQEAEGRTWLILWIHEIVSFPQKPGETSKWNEASCFETTVPSFSDVSPSFPLCSFHGNGRRTSQSGWSVSFAILSHISWLRRTSGWAARPCTADKWPKMESKSSDYLKSNCLFSRLCHFMVILFQDLSLFHHYWIKK